MIRVAAVADLHCREDRPPRFREAFAALNEEADVFVIAGDLTHFGRTDEARIVVGELSMVRIPILAVLGNHDWHSDETEAIKAVFRDRGIIMLDDGAHRVEVNGRSAGFAGAKGFGGGFGNAHLTPFGEDAIKVFAKATMAETEKLDRDLQGLDASYRVAVLHYAPIRDTLSGESFELYPFLGSSLLSGPIDRLGVDLVLHGHAHHGVEIGRTETGIPVRNVALPVLKRHYVIYELGS
jgi:Icc-related predicted phosphoesterase